MIRYFERFAVCLSVVFVLSCLPTFSQNVTISNLTNNSNPNINVTFARNLNDFLRGNPGVKLLKPFFLKSQNESLLTKSARTLTYVLGYRVYGK